MTAIPSIDSYWVLPDKLLAGQYPGGNNEETTRKRVQSLIHAGIDTILDLTMPGDAFLPYTQVLQSEAADFGVKIERFNFPILDYDIPTREQMGEILGLIDTHLAQGKRVYVHCIGGRGRTGTVVGCFLVNHGRSGQEALSEIEHLRRDVASWWQPSPESNAQIDFVLNWSKG